MAKQVKRQMMAFRLHPATIRELEQLYCVMRLDSVTMTLEVAVELLASVVRLDGVVSLRMPAAKAAINAIGRVRQRRQRERDAGQDPSHPADSAE